MITDAQNVKIKKLKSVPFSSFFGKWCLQYETVSPESVESTESGESIESGESKNYSLLFPLPSSLFHLPSLLFH